MRPKDIAVWTKAEILRKLAGISTDGKLDFYLSTGGSVSGGGSSSGGAIVEGTLYDRHIAIDAAITGTKINQATTSVRGTVELANDLENSAGLAVQSNDSRLHTSAVAGSTDHDGRYVLIVDLASNAVNKGASLVGIQDSKKYYTATTVEGALEEIGSSVSQLEEGAIFLAPEFPNAVLYADGSSNLGTMDGYFDITNKRNTYRWTTTEGSAQDYDIVAQFMVPYYFQNWTSGVLMNSLVSDSSGNTGVRLVALYDTTGVNRITASTKQNAAWAEDEYAITGGVWAEGELATLQFKVIADNADYAYLGHVRIDYVINRIHATTKDLSLIISVSKSTTKDLTLDVTVFIGQIKDLTLDINVTVVDLTLQVTSVVNHKDLLLQIGVI